VEAQACLRARFSAFFAAFFAAFSIALVLSPSPAMRSSPPSAARFFENWVW
jgi:hypothetical protein